MSFRDWQKTTINTPSGIVQAVAPVIISASRATDIPAFYSYSITIPKTQPLPHNH
jgi:hypothetical protein